LGGASANEIVKKIAFKIAIWKRVNSLGVVLKDARGVSLDVFHLSRTEAD
jgi:hypothetical protein